MRLLISGNYGNIVLESAVAGEGWAFASKLNFSKAVAMMLAVISGCMGNGYWVAEFLATGCS